MDFQHKPKKYEMQNKIVKTDSFETHLKKETKEKYKF
jgi:hypothetical protein